MSLAKSALRACVIMVGILAPASFAGAQATLDERVPQKATRLPADVDPESRSRLPLVKREDLDDSGKKAFDAVVDPASRLKAEIVGPAGIWLHAPELSPHIREINWYLRNRIKLEPKLTELAILATVRETDGETEWAAHEPAALKAGLTQNVIDIVKFRRAIAGVAPAEAAIMNIARELLGQKRLSAETYAAGLQQFGQKNLVELILLIANYAQTSIILHAFNQQLRPDLQPLLPVTQR